MLNGSIGDQLWAEMTDGQKVDAVYQGHATLKQLSEGLLDGSEELRNACREHLAHTDPSFENLVVEDNHLGSLDDEITLATRQRSLSRLLIRNRQASANSTNTKQRFGLPEGFVPRLQRFGRAVLLELNVYRLPNGQEFIPAHPTGTLGRQHLYALLTVEQFLKGVRGSVYIRSDGRIFDYSVDNGKALGDIFDTGYTIYDLERTGRYAPSKRKKLRKRSQLKVRRASAGN